MLFVLCTGGKNIKTDEKLEKLRWKRPQELVLDTIYRLKMLKNPTSG